MNKAVSAILFVSIVFSVQACNWFSWWNKNVYNGARTFKNKTFTDLEIHGAAKLKDVNVDGDVLITGAVTWSRGLAGGDVEIRGSSTLQDIKIAGNVEISGSCTWLRCAAEGSAEVQGSFKITDSEVMNKLTIKGSFESVNTAFYDVTLNKSIDAEKSTFKNIVAKGDMNRTLRFLDSSFDKLSVQGTGDRFVILNGSSAEAITFENKGGIVKLLNGGSVKKLTNGTVEEDEE